MEPTLLEQCIIDAENELEKQTADYLSRKDLYDTLAEIFKPMAIRISMPNSIDITVCGDRQSLVKSLRVLRKFGYRAEITPEENITNYSQFFRVMDQDGVYDNSYKPVWFSWSSTVCRRVQVGTEMKEVPVYAIDCSGGDDNGK
jgi:hypothetical protein